MDRERILSRLAQLDSYLGELRGIAPATFEEYRGVRKRACERLAQVATLRQMKGFRNTLMHECTAVDDRIVYEVVTSRLQDLKGFATEVRAVLAERGER